MIFRRFGLRKQSPNRGFFDTFPITPIFFKLAKTIEKTVVFIDFSGFGLPKIHSKSMLRCIQKNIETKISKNRFWLPSWPPKISQNGAQNFVVLGHFEFLFGVQKCSSFLSCFGSPLRRPKRAQKAPKTPQGAPQSALRWLKKLPKAPQEAPRGPQESPSAGQEGSATPTMPC